MNLNTLPNGDSITVGKIKKRLSVKEAAELLGVTPQRIRKMIADGVLKDVEKFANASAIAEDEVMRLVGQPRTAGRPKKKGN